jgi:hypothetical protein
MSALETAGERFSAILVKEVRQALRGRYFMVAFWFTLSLALILLLREATRVNLDDGDVANGRRIFEPIFISLAIACHGLVPFAAFQSIGNEWDEGTFDLLVLSNLTPPRIVMGKLWSASTQALLVYSALLPFFGFAFLCGGIDVLSVLVVLGLSILMTLASVAFALGMSSLTRIRIGRVILAFVTAVCLTASTWASAYAGIELVRNPETVHAREFLLAAAFIALFLGSIGGLALAIAFARLSHAEENRSSLLRIVGLVIVTAVYLTLRYSASSAGPDRSFFAVVVFLVAAFVYVHGIFGLTERESLPRRLRVTVPKRALLAFLAAPFLPGGGRGFVYFILVACVGLAGAAWLQSTLTAGVGFPGGLVAGWIVLMAYIGFACAIPGVFVASRVKDGRSLAVARTILFLTHIVILLLPVLFGVLTGENRLRDMENPLNPIWTYDQILDEPSPVVLASAVLVLTLTALVNLPRAAYGVKEVLDASRDRRLREEAIPAETPSHAATGA